MGLADEVGGSFAATGERLGVKTATLIKVTSSMRVPGAVSGGTNPTTTSTPCKGFVSSYSANRIDGTLVRAQDRLISLFASTLAGVVPATGDRITIEGTTYTIVGGISRDPASVLYECQGRA